MAYNPPLVNTEYIFYITLEDFANAGEIKANPTLAAGDIVTSLDGGAFGNVNAYSVTPASGKAVKITLSAAQMNGDNVVVIASDQTSPKEWADFSINIQPVAAVWSTATALTTLQSKMLKYFQLIARVDAAITTDNATELTEINADGGSGGGSYANQTKSLMALTDGTNIFLPLSDNSLDGKLSSFSDTITVILTKLRKYFQLALRSDTGIATDNATELAELNADESGGGTGFYDNTTRSLMALVIKIRKYLQLTVRKDTYIATDNATELAELNANEESGGGTFANTTDSVQALADAALTAAAVNAEVDTALTDINLDHLVKVAKDTNWATTVTKESIIDLMTSKTTAQAFDRATDALEAVSDKVTTVSAGVASSITATANTETTGTLVSGTYADTYLSNGTYYITAPVTPAVGGYGLNAYLTLGAASGQYINSVTIRGYFRNATGSARFLNVGAYNYVSNAIDILSDPTSRMNHATANATYTYALLSSHQKADGEVRIYFLSTSTTTGDRLNIDQLLVNVNTAGASAADIAAAVKQNMITLYYPDGVWIDTTGSGTAGTVTGVNGLRTNPCSTYADAIAICASLNIKQLRLKNGSSIELTQSHDKWTFVGGTILLASQSIADANFIDCYTVQGVSSGDDYTMERCGVGTMTGAHGYFYDCAFKGTFTMLASQVYYLYSCVDFTNTATACQFVYAASAELIARGWKGGMELLSMAATNTAVIDGAGRLIITDTSEGGAITVRGFFPPVVGGAGLHTVAEFVAHGGTFTQTTRYDADQINAEVVDVLRTDTLPDSYAAHEAQPTLSQAVLEILQFLTEKSVTSTTVSVKKPDGSTAVMEFTLDSATAPTAITRKANP